MMSNKYMGNSEFINFFQSHFSGSVADFDTSWFRNVGVILIVNFLFNTISVLALVSFRAMSAYIQKVRLKGCSFNKEKQTNIVKLRNIFIGPEFEIYFSYSTVTIF